MNESIIIERLAQGLLKCPFDQELFGSSLSLRLHLCAAHLTQISRPHRVACNTVVREQRPQQLYCCPQCDFVVSDTFDRSPLSEIINHIRAEHPNPNPFEPARLSFGVSADEELIDGYMDRQESVERRACIYSGCNIICADDDSVALHWAEDHCQPATVEETRQALETDAERFRVQLAETLAEITEEETRKRLAYREADDGYAIQHSPSVPRVRSSPAESLVYVERESVRFLDRELDELLEREGWDIEAEATLGEEWKAGRQQSITVELRFCNIVDGYVPLVKDVRRILPPLMDGEAIEVSWQGEPDSGFPCKVSRSKRAIYNLDGRLKSVFTPFPSGVRLYISRVGTRRYLFGVKRHPHTVPNCKVFVDDGFGGWKVEIHDNEPVEWETGDQVFRHQLTFQQMEALHDEARKVHLSVRDAVHEVMKCLAQGQPVHVRSVHDAVFLWMRTCSLVSVWAQFRPEHQCYVRVQPGWYRFDSSKPLPQVRIVAPPSPRRNALRPYSRQEKRYRVKQRTWRHNIYRSRLEEYQNDENACLEVRCAFGTPEETVFVIPIPYLMEQVIPHADCNELGRYLFTVNQHDFIFTWDHGFKMDGKPFLDRSNSENDRLVE